MLANDWKVVSLARLVGDGYAYLNAADGAGPMTPVAAVADVVEAKNAGVAAVVLGAGRPLLARPITTTTAVLLGGPQPNILDLPQRDTPIAHRPLCVSRAAPSPNTTANIQYLSARYSAGEDFYFRVDGVSAEKNETAPFLNLGTTVEVVMTGRGEMVLDDTDFAVKQFHFHTPSEHTLEGEKFPLEMHIVHQAPNGSIAVLGILFEPTGNKTNTDHFFAPISRAVDDIASPGNQTTVTGLDLNALIGPFNNVGGSDIIEVYTYTGSLTTPPCTEGVSWFVLSKPLLVNVDSYNALSKVLKFNARYTQSPLGQTNYVEAAAHDVAAQEGCKAVSSDGNTATAGDGSTASGNSVADGNSAAAGSSTAGGDSTADGNSNAGAGSSSGSAN
ncbi:Alpha carbonic anhydrase [Mycena kentingensis (nom. inval.)]|nr:Alpha carbonic anhydrase [Mycena kentingensis (nom. inval.)]